MHGARDGARGRALAGIFVGGRSSRMGGAPKGLLAAPDGGAIVVRTQQLLIESGLECVLVGAHPAYAHLGIEAVPDDPRAVGPLGGLLALLSRAEGRSVLAVACDLPYLSLSLVERLLDAPPAPVVAPRHGGFWQPLFARYAAHVLPIAVAQAEAGKLRLQDLLAAAGAHELALSDDEVAHLHDWDAPEDIARSTMKP